MDKIKHRYEAGMLELPPQQKSRALHSKSSKKQKQATPFAESVPEASDRDVVLVGDVSDTRDIAESVPEASDRNVVLVGDVSDTRDMSMSSTSMSMSMYMSMSMSMPMSMSMSMSMSL